MSIKFLENTKMLAAIVANIESCERSFQTKGLESLSVSLNKNERGEVGYGYNARLMRASSGRKEMKSFLSKERKTLL